MRCIVHRSALGDVLVPAVKLGNIIRESSDETVTLEQVDSALEIRGEDSVFKIYGQDPRDFPPVA